VTDPANHTFDFIQSDAELEAFAREYLPLIDGNPIAVDIEEDREHRYNPSVALIQITVDRHDFVIDPINVSRSAFLPVIEAVCLTPSIVVMHGCRNDVTGLKRDFGVGPERVGDTQTASRFLGAEAFGLAALLGARFDVKLNKEVRRSNWLRRPLSDDQLAYAREDTRYLLNLWSELESEVEASGWLDALHEECAALAVLYPEPSVFDPFGWQRAKGVKQLANEQQLRAAALWRWRDQVARSQNRHPSRTLPPWAVVYLARLGIGALDGPPPKGLPRGLTDPQYAALERALESPNDVPLSRPRAKRRSSRLAPDVFDGRMQRLSQWRADLSEETGLDSGFVAPKSVLESVARADVDSPDDYSTLSDVRGWRARRWANAWWDLR
jgi:ribonuclease D